MSLQSIFKLSLIMDMVDHLTGPMAGVTSQVQGQVSALQSAQQAFGGMTKAGAVMQEVGSQITSAVLEPVEATFETRRAIGELASLGVEDLGAVEDAARSFSNQWSGTTKADFISAAYDIKSGIASLSDEGVAEFTSLSALTAKATKASASEMTSLFATGYGIYKDYYNDLTDMEFGEMFSAGISQSVKQFKTTGSGMAQSIQSLGASATTANVPLEEQLSILGMLQSTMSGSEAGTKYKAFLRSAAKGGEALGLSFTDANNQLLSMPEILDKLQGKFGETMDAAEKMELQKAFGDTEAVALIDLMYNKVGDLQDNILGMYDALGSGTGVAQEMASAIQETEPERFQRLQQQIRNVTESIGSSFLPTINDLMGKGEQLLTKADSWISENQELVRVILLAVLAVGGFLTVGGTAVTVVGGLGLAFTKAASLGGSFIKAVKNIPDTLDTIRLYGMFAGDALKKGFSLVRSAGGVAASAVRQFGSTLFSMAKGALTTAISSVWSFTTALLANPVTWIVIAIVALVAALVLLYRNWDSVTAFVKSAWTSACSAVSGGIEALRTGFNNMVTWVNEKISWFGEAGKRLISTFVDGIKSVASAPVNAVKGIFEKVNSLFPHSDAKEGPLSTLTLSGQRTMTTYAGGITQAQNAPAEALEKSFQRTNTALRQEPVGKIRLDRREDEQDGSSGEDMDTHGAGKRVIIQKLILQTDLKKIKDLQRILKILEELEEYSETTEDGDDDPDAGLEAV